MRYNKIILPVVALAMLLTGCDDQIMEWGTPEGHAGVTKAEIPLAVKEVLANYDVIKTYSAENHPNMVLGLGFGKDLYMGEDGRRQLAAGNFQMITWGNAMKMDAMVSNTGSLNTAALEPALDALKADEMKLWGHNFFWHTQQNQTYLKSLIRPTLVIESDSDIKNELPGDASNFDGGTTGGWGSWGGNKDNVEVVAGAGPDGSSAAVLTNKGDGNFWEAQNAYTFEEPLQIGKKYIIQFYAKSTSAAGELQFQYQNGKTYGEQGGYNTFEVGTDWTLCESEFTIDDPEKTGVTRIILNFGKIGGTYYIDDVKFGLAKDQSAAAAKKRAARRAAKTYYVIKSDEEKREALLGAMESWVKNMADYLKSKDITPVGYDVINEAIADGNNKVRGVDNVFGGSDGDGNYDGEPTESVADGLELNWASGHFYWGYYVKDYAVRAFEYARQYLPAETKLFYNDYNLETSDAKRQAAIKFVQDIDQAHGSVIVDGIGTQMHITLSGTSDDAENNAAKVAALRAQVDKQFQELAATGKLIRITELDVSLGTSSPSSAQYKAQSDAYQTIFESYFANVPENQQSGITIWSLTDAEDEHEYWLKGEKPNLFDDAFKRKWAYKGVCDGLAGEDLGLKYGGEDYKAYYEKQNVSETVK